MGMLLRRYKQVEDPAVKEKTEVKVEKTEVKAEVKTEVKKGRTKKK